MSIDCCPSFLQGFFRPFRRILSKPQFTHLWSLVLAVAMNLRQAKLLHLAQAVPSRHRTRCGAFLSDSTWDAPALLEQTACGLLARMKPQPGEVVYLILDDIRVGKRGKTMDWTSKIWDHKAQHFIRGHMILTGAIVFRGVVLPWRIQLWKPKGHPGLPRYRKLTAMAAEMIRGFVASAGLKVRVLFDAFYLCPQVTQACRAQGFEFFSVAQKSRCFTTANGKRRSIRQLAPGLIRHHGRNVRMKRARKTAKLRIAWTDGRLSRIGAVRLVLSKRPGNPWKKLVAIVTSETNLTARQIVAAYELRWLIEVLFKQLAQDLGLGDYQMLDHQGISRHLHLVCLAHLMLTHRSLERLGAQATTPHKQVTLPTMQQRLQSLRQEAIRDQIRRLVKGPHHARLRQKLYDHLLEAA